MTKTQFRRLVVRAIEDACILLFGGICIWLVCSIVSNVFRLLGVS